MDENAMRQWFIDCFGPVQGEMAWNQLSQLPDEIREQLMSQDIGKLPKPEEVQSLMQAFTAGGLNTFGDMKQTVESGPINVKLAKSIALQKANADALRVLTEANASDKVVQLKSLEAFAKAADGKATKIIIPSELQSLAGMASSLKELVSDR